MPRCRPTARSRRAATRPRCCRRAGRSRHGGFSGVSGYTARLAGALADRGAAVAVVAPTEDGAPAREQHGAVTVERRFAPGAAALPRAAQAARATGAPVIHLQHET